SPTSNKTILGGILCGIIGILIARWWFRFKKPVWDAFAFALPICMAIQRVGCLMRGCCFGKPTNLPWAIKYSFESMPYHVHLNSGLIDPISNTSLSIHPTQLYQIIYCLAIVFIIWRIRKFWKAPGNLFFSSVILYGVFRFFSEFFRDPAADGNLGGIFVGLKYVQWGILIFILVFYAYIIYRERSWRLKLKIPELTSNILYRNLLFITFLTSLIWLGRNWFTVLELTVLYIIILPGIIGVCWQIYKALTIPSLRWLPPALVAGCLIFIGQTYINKDTDDSISSYNTFSVGGMGGKYEYWKSTGCGTGYDVEKKYGVGGIAFSSTRLRDEYRKGTFGMRLYGGNAVDFRLDYKTKDDHILFCINPYYHYDWRYLGLGSGVLVGSLGRYAFGGAFDIQFDLRLGPYDIFFTELSVNDHFPGSYPAPITKIGIGTGFGLTNGTVLRFGNSFNAGTYLSASLPIKNNLIIESFYGFADPILLGRDPGRQFSLTLHYRFGQKANNKKR
ncbi:MAG: prolipoprotein diacylglyceryl transferase, partial [Bacteroidales bacterium]|nr:prolipoprotein diacylglyceryl transferase [Bacteroidales bacterium]